MLWLGGNWIMFSHLGMSKFKETSCLCSMTFIRFCFFLGVACVFTGQETARNLANWFNYLWQTNSSVGYDGYLWNYIQGYSEWCILL